MNSDSINSIFAQINESACDYFEIESFSTNRLEGDDVLVLRCCWCDASPGNILFRLRFSNVDYLACAKGFHDATIRVGSHQDLRTVREMCDFSELAEPGQLFCIETNRPDRYQDPTARGQFKTDIYYVLARDVTIEDCRNC